MKKITSYIDDDSFLDWVLQPNSKSNIYWNSYLLEFPEEKNNIDTLREIIFVLKTEDTKLTSIEKEKILNELLKKTNTSSKPYKNPFRIKKLLKYAAIFITLISIGGYLINNFGNTNKYSFENFESFQLDSITETQLITGVKKQVIINKNQSTVKYHNSGNIIINKKDTLAYIAKKKIEKEVLNEMIVPYGKRSKITLADGTIVHLNSGTRLIFPEKFIGKQRTVLLVGEAFFEVSSNKKRPFIVKTIDNDFSIEVVGTKFNVSAYPSDQEILTVLTEGEVHLNENNTLFSKNTTKLKPGESGTWSTSDKEVIVKTVNTDNYTLWIEGVLQFESES